MSNGYTGRRYMTGSDLVVVDDMSEREEVDMRIVRAARCLLEMVVGLGSPASAGDFVAVFGCHRAD